LKITIVGLGFLMVLAVFGSGWTWWTGQQQYRALTDQVSNLRNSVTAQSNTDILFLKIMLMKPSVEQDFAYRIAGLIDQYSQRRAVDPDLVVAVMDVESRFNPGATSRVGAVGLMQVMPFWIGVRDIEGDLYDPEVNIKHGTAILAEYLDAYRDLATSIAAYNRGPTLVNRDLREGRDPVNRYAQDVLARYHKLKAITGKLRN
jgi:soluble lytic murein transglycosylase-like protein